MSEQFYEKVAIRLANEAKEKDAKFEQLKNEINDLKKACEACKNIHSSILTQAAESCRIGHKEIDRLESVLREKYADIAELKKEVAKLTVERDYLRNKVIIQRDVKPSRAER